ncbi:MAG TPA: TonB-dependent receptor [Longimicrobiales bacterium]|nr:TonB-dependent receptor [Longimicrobiales bacterium]
MLPALSRLALRVTLLVLAVLAGLPWGPGPLRAQSPDSIPADSVIPMAPLRVEVLRTLGEGARTPYAVSGLGPDELVAERPSGFLADALVALPGLEVQNRFNFAVGERLAVRGFGARSQFGVRGLKVYLDGVPATLPDGQTTLDHVNPQVLERAELMRGPGAALYGNGAGGVLLLRSRRPEEGQRMTLWSQGGSHGYLQLSGAAERARGTTASRIQITRLAYDGFRGDGDGGTYGQAERWTTTATHSMALGGGTLSVMAVGVELDAENPGSLPADRLEDPTRPAWGFNVAQGTGKEVRQLQLGGTWERAFGGLDSRTTLWGLTRDVTNPIPTSVIDLGRTGLGGTVGLGGHAGAIRWDTGIDVEAQLDDRRNFENDGGSSGDLTLSQDETVTGLGVYAAAAWTKGIGNVHAALRYDRFRFEVEDLLVLAGEPDESGSRTMDAWSPSLGAALDLGAVRVFSSVSSFLETPTTTELANRPDGAGGFNPELEPTRGWTTELGIRGIVAGRVGWELVGFYTSLTDELIPFEVPTDPGRTFYRNAGESSHRGVEAALRMSFARGLTGRLAYTWVDARFDSGELDGNRIPGRTPNLLEAVLEQRLGNAFVSLRGHWTDDIPVDDANTATADGYVLLELRAGFDALQVGGTRLSPWAAVQNLFDETYVSSVAVNAFGSRFFEPGPGRTLQVGLQAVFDWR